MKKHVVAGLALGCMMMAFADTEVVDGVEWRYRVINGKVSIGMYKGIDYLSEAKAVPSTTTGKLSIPEKLGSLDVVEIGPYAFYGVRGITEVVIPDSVTNICDSAFYADNYLSNVVLSASSRLGTIGEYAFGFSYSLISINLPQSLKRIGCCAFIMCSSLRRIELPQSITSIEDETFSQSGLRTIVICGNLSSIGAEAFLNCNLQVIYFRGNEPEYVSPGYYGEFVGVSPSCHVYVAEDAIWETPIPGTWYGFSLERAPKIDVRANVEDGRKFIGEVYVSFSKRDYETVWYTLDGTDPRTSQTRRVCDGSIRITQTCELKYYGTTDYGDASEVKSARYFKRLADGGPYQESVDGADWTFQVINGESVVSDVNKCAGSVVIPDELGGCSVVAIPAGQFERCMELESVVFPDGLRTIPANAFRECVKLESITIPASVTNIGCFAFRDCLGLWNVTFKGFVPGMGPGAFMGVPAITAISGRIGSASAIIYAEVTNSTGRIDVPKGWLDELAVKFDPPAGFASYQEAFESRFGSDFGAALTKTTGKHDLAGNKMEVWQDYVAGTNPLDGEDTFKAMIAFENGIPVVKWNPKLPVQQEALRKYKVFGATVLRGEWVDVSDMSDADRYAAGYQFFKVSVEMR